MRPHRRISTSALRSAMSDRTGRCAPFSIPSNHGSRTMPAPAAPLRPTAGWRRQESRTPVPDLPKRSPKLEPGKPWPGVRPSRCSPARAGRHACATSAPRTGLYAGPVVEAVRRFQQRHGLEVDGIVGVGTIKALNVPLAQRVRQIELAMERMRWLPTLTERPNVFVNVALFRMWATDPVTGEEPLRMNVVVGKSLDHRTPLFIEEMEYVVFRPYWNPPSQHHRSRDHPARAAGPVVSRARSARNRRERR